MTDRELVVNCAEKVIGWPISFGGDMKQRVYARDNDRVLVLWDEYGEVAMCRKWNPLESDADAFMLVDALIAQGWRVAVQWPYVPSLPKWHVCVQRTADPLAEDSFHGESSDRRRAIVIASLRAAGVEA